MSSAWGGAVWIHPFIERVSPIHCIFTRTLVVFTSPTVHRVLFYPLPPLSLEVGQAIIIMFTLCRSEGPPVETRVWELSWEVTLLPSKSIH